MLSTSELLNGLNGSHVPYFVIHPLDIIVDRNTQYWTSNDIFNPPVHDPTIVWQDPYSDINDENSANVETLDKSIFDPCPPGWTVPVAEVNPKGYWDVIYKNNWTSRLSGDQQGSATASTSANCQYLTDPSGKGAGRIYYPLGYLNSKNDPEAPSIFFPATISTELHLHSSTSYGLGTSIVTELSANRVLIYDVASSTKTGLYNIRCIKKSY
jgi:hypothetical protein